MMTPQTYNFVAKRIREDFPTEYENDTITLVKRGTLVDFALRCAFGFSRDNPGFDIMRFLDACSPDPERWPIAELWVEFKNEHREDTSGD